ncbi:MAG: C26 family cysteine hydrolase domain-containing family, partial [Gammaproteobacteria bacterium]|nr:C26 family cysteine hydrolase domain-containing family [Gammaproteobacteria bacterium]
MSLRIHYIMHASFETPGIIDEWAKEIGADYTGTKTYAGEILPTADQIDFLVVMGGPQSPIEIDKAPYLKDEISLIADVIAAKKPIIGFCLGAQLIAEALGAKTERSPEKEVGIYPIQLTPEGQQDAILKTFPVEFNVVHWHNDMPGIPEGAVLL